MSPWGPRLPISPALAEAIAAVRNGRSYDRHRKALSKVHGSSEDDLDKRKEGQSGQRPSLVERRRRGRRMSSSSPSPSSPLPERKKRDRRKASLLDSSSDDSSSPDAAEEDRQLDTNKHTSSSRTKTSPTESSTERADFRSRFPEGPIPNSPPLGQKNIPSPHSDENHGPDKTPTSLPHPSRRQSNPPISSGARSQPPATLLPGTITPVRGNGTAPREKEKSTSPMLPEPSDDSPPPFGLYDTYTQRTPTTLPGRLVARPLMPSPPSDEPELSPTESKGSRLAWYGLRVQDGGHWGGKMDEVIAAADYGVFFGCEKIMSAVENFYLCACFEIDQERLHPNLFVCL